MWPSDSSCFCSVWLCIAVRYASTTLLLLLLRSISSTQDCTLLWFPLHLPPLLHFLTTKNPISGLFTSCTLHYAPPHHCCIVFSCPGSSIPDLGQSVSHWLSGCHFRILTQRVTFDTSDPSDIWSEWCLDKKNKMTKWQNDINIHTLTKWQKDQKTKNRVLYCDVRAVLHSCNVLNYRGVWTD